MRTVVSEGRRKNQRSAPSGRRLASGGWPIARCERRTRDGTLVLLRIEDPVTIGAWTPDDVLRASYWRVFAVEYGSTAYFDKHIRGWLPLPRTDDT